MYVHFRILGWPLASVGILILALDSFPVATEGVSSDGTVRT